MIINNLKKKFVDLYKIKKNYSQAAQDLFVISCLNGKKNGTYLDLGCNEPININNTYLLEEIFEWEGVSYDIDKNLVDKHSVRKNPAFCEDCTKLDFNNVIKKLGTSKVDYLSLDLEPASVTLECLKNIPFNDIEFSIITYEHDLYRFGEFYKYESRNIFKKYGYQLICGDVRNGVPYEDWYYNPKYISYEDVKIFYSENTEWKNILF